MPKVSSKRNFRRYLSVLYFSMPSLSCAPAMASLDRLFKLWLAGRLQMKFTFDNRTLLTCCPSVNVRKNTCTFIFTYSVWSVESIIASTSSLTALSHVLAATLSMPYFASSSWILQALFDNHGMLRDVRKTFIPVAPNPAFMDPIAHEKSETIFFQNDHKKSQREQRYQECATMFTLKGFPACKYLLGENMGGNAIKRR